MYNLFMKRVPYNMSYVRLLLRCGVSNNLPEKEYFISVPFPMTQCVQNQIYDDETHILGKPQIVQLTIIKQIQVFYITFFNLLYEHSKLNFIFFVVNPGVENQQIYILAL